MDQEKHGVATKHLVEYRLAGSTDFYIGTTSEGVWRRPLSEFGTTSVEDQTVSLNTFLLSQNYPNPFNPATVISYQLSVFSSVNLSVYDILGREVVTLVSGEQPAGVYKTEWNASVASGVYFYRLEAVGKDGNAFVETKKMMLVR